jgi:hypothetical protein
MRWIFPLVALAGCGEPIADTDVDLDTGVPGFAADIAPKMVACTGCHGGDAPDGALDLRTDAYATLKQESGQAPLRLVEPGDYLASYLWHKLNGSQALAGGAGTRMPLGEPWSAEDLELVAVWIDLGMAP